jgi:hypothetical protein
MKIKIVDLNKAGFTVIDLNPEAVAIRGHGVETLASREAEHVVVKAPKFIIRPFLDALARLNVPVTE